MRLLAMSIAWALLICGASLADEPPAAAEPRDESGEYVVETLIQELNNPACIAVHPGLQPAGPYRLYVAESGAGRVISLTTDKPADSSTVIAGFPLGDFGPDGQLRGGPLGLEFLSRNRLAVGTGGLGAGADLVRVYALPDAVAELAYDDADHSAGPVPQGGRTTTGEGQFASLARTENALFVAPRSGDERGWILKAILDSNRVAGLEPFLATRKLAGGAAPAAVTVNPKKNFHYLVIAHMGKPTAERDSRITMVSPASGDLALQLMTGLRDVVGLAYSPTGDLYAVDAAWANVAEGGVFRLDAATVDGRESCRAVKIAAVERPTSLAFTPDGTLYVTALGNRDDADDKPTGVLLKITPNPDAPKL